MGWFGFPLPWLMIFSHSTLDLLDWTSLIDSRTELSKHLVVPNMQVMVPWPCIHGSRRPRRVAAGDMMVEVSS